MTITSKEIAALAGVSRQAVSAVLNGRGTSKVSAQKRDLILRIAREQHYLPNKTALKLAGKQTRTVGVIMDAFTGLVAQRMQRITRELFYAGYATQAVVFENAVQAHQAIGNFIAAGVDALIFPNYLLSEIRHEELPVPAVVFDVDVVVDYAYGMELTVKHLWGHGHRRFCCVLNELLFANLQKYNGFCRAVDQLGGTRELILLDEVADFTAVIDHAMEQGIRAFCVGGGPSARQLIDFLNARGIRVPEDCAVTGFDGLRCYGSFSTVVDPIQPFVDATVAMLLHKIEQRQLTAACEPAMVSPCFFPGSSCGCKAECLMPDDSFGSFETHPAVIH